MSAVTGIDLGDLLLGFASTDEVAGVSVAGLALDSRRLEPGDAFVAVAGEAGHGMDHLAAAQAAGAVALLHDGECPVPDGCTIPVVAVERLRARLPELARRIWGDPGEGMDLIAVTGTNGKSSVAWLLAQALDGAMIGTLGIGRPGTHRSGGLTTPDLFSVYRALAGLRDAGCRSVVIEASSHALAQQRLAGLAFSCVILTSLGHDHLDYHGTREAYAGAKAKLFEQFDSRRQLINLDDDFGVELAERLSASPGLSTYSLDPTCNADVCARLISAGRDGLRAAITLPGFAVEVQSRLIGRVNLYNLMIVAAELAARGFDADRVGWAIAALEPVPGRMQPVSGVPGAGVIIDYAHTPDALNNALVSLRGFTDGELWCVFGCGGDRDRDKRPRMGRVAESLADRVVLTDDNPRFEGSRAIIRDIQAGMRSPQRSRVIPDRAEAIAWAMAEAAPEDLILVAGKGHETEQIVGDTVRAFSDRAEVERIAGVAT